MSDVLPAKKFQLVGGDLCLDYCNTMGGKREGIPREKLSSYLDFLCWCSQSGLVDDAQAKLLMEQASRDPNGASSALARAVELREAIYHLFLAVLNKEAPPIDDLKRLNSELAKALGRLRIAPNENGGGFSWRWASPPAELADPLGPLAHAAAGLLASPEVLKQVRQCHGDNCGWLFIDSSKNHSRRWCDMRDCGNRAKVRRHRQKHPAAGIEPGR